MGFSPKIICLQKKKILCKVLVQILPDNFICPSLHTELHHFERTLKDKYCRY